MAKPLDGDALADEVYRMEKADLEFQVLNAMELNRETYFAGLEEFVYEDFSGRSGANVWFKTLADKRDILDRYDCTMDYTLEAKTYERDSLAGIYSHSAERYERAKVKAAKAWKEIFAELKRVNEEIKKRSMKEKRNVS